MPRWNVRHGISARIALLAVLATGLLLASCQKTETIRLGFVGGLTGRNGDLGTAGRDGAILAVETINENGGINGRKLELVIRDDKSDPAEAVNAVKDLVAGKVDAIVGPMTSVVAMATVPIIKDAKLLMLSPTVSTTELTGQDDHFIRLIENRGIASAAADQMAAKLGIRKAAVLYDISNRAFTETLVRGFRTRFTELGGAVIAERTFNGRENVDFLALARELNSRRPQGLFIVAGALDSAMVCQQLKKLGSKSTIVISEWGGTSEFLKSGGRAAEGVYTLQHYNGDSTEPAFRSFRAAYEKRFGEPPIFAAAYSYEAVMMIAEALGRDPRPSRLKDTIVSIGTFTGLQGTFHIDRFGDPVRPFTVMRVEGGRFVTKE